MTLKELKKLAVACRSVGISHFKNSEVEFTLTPDAPESNYKKKQKDDTFHEEVLRQQDLVGTDTLTEEQLLMYSVVDPTEGLSPGTDQ